MIPNVQNGEDAASAAAESSAGRGASTEPKSLRRTIRPKCFPPGAWRMIVENNERVKKKEARLVTILLRDYPTGVLPAWGVTMCVLYLREEHPDECGLDDHWLNLVQVGEDDQTWLLNDIAQGGVRHLISWIGGYSGDCSLEAEYIARLWYGSACILVREELERRAAAAQP